MDGTKKKGVGHARRIRPGAAGPGAGADAALKSEGPPLFQVPKRLARNFALAFKYRLYPLL